MSTLNEKALPTTPVPALLPSKFAALF